MTEVHAGNFSGLSHVIVSETSPSTVIDTFTPKLEVHPQHVVQTLFFVGLLGIAFSPNGRDVTKGMLVKYLQQCLLVSYLYLSFR